MNLVPEYALLPCLHQISLMRDGAFKPHCPLRFTDCSPLGRDLSSIQGQLEVNSQRGLIATSLQSCRASTGL
jgi:hypothetical protein